MRVLYHFISNGWKLEGQSNRFASLIFQMSHLYFSFTSLLSMYRKKNGMNHGVYVSLRMENNKD